MADLSVFGKFRGFSDYQQEAKKNSLAEALVAAQILRAEQAATGADPAAVKITNEMQKAAEAFNDPNASEQDKIKAKFRYDTLNQVAKSYAIDRGMTPAMPDFQARPMPDFQPPPVLPTGITPPPRDMPTSDAMNMPMTPDNAAKVVELFGGDGQPVREPSGVKPIPGFNSILASREAAVKGAGKQAEKNVELKMNPPIEKATKRAGEIGKFEGEEYNDLTNRSARMPQLIDVAGRLSALGKLATYTYAGQARDAIARQTGMDIPDAAVARSAYISMVDNEILPLLRETFGAQFTQKEGESLKVTLGDPNKSPEEKDAVLRSFLQTKMETINTGARKLGQPLPYSPEDIQAAVASIGAGVTPVAAPSIAGNTPIIKTQAQFDALPSGARYIEIVNGKPKSGTKP